MLIPTHPTQTHSQPYNNKGEIEFDVNVHVSRPPPPVTEISPDADAEISEERWATWVRARAWDAYLSRNPTVAPLPHIAARRKRKQVHACYSQLSGGRSGLNLDVLDV